MSDVYASIVDALYAGNATNLRKVMGFYNIRFVLQRNDFASDFFNDYDSPEFIKQKMKAFDATMLKTIGQWDFYDFGSENTKSLIYPANYFIDVTSMDENILLPVMLTEKEAVVLLEDASSAVLHNEEYYSADTKKLSTLTKKSEPVPPVIPDANVDPNNLLYPLVRLREAFQLVFKAKSPVEKADTHLWLSLKRHVEIDSYALDPRKATQLYENSLTHLRHYMDIVSEISDPNEQIGLAEKGLQTIDVLDNTFSADVATALSKDINILNTITASREVSTCDAYCYKFNIDTEGIYDLYSLDSGYSSLAIDYSSVEVVSNSIRVDADTFSLPKGEVEFILNSDTNESIHVDSIDSIDIDNFRRELDTKNTRGLIDGIEVFSAYKYSAKIPDYKSTYNITLHYKTPVRVGLAIVQESLDTSQKLQLHSEVLDPTETISTFKHQVTTSNGIAALNVYLYPVENGVPSFESLEVERIVKPNLVLRKVNQVEDTGELPSITFKRINPTKYLVNLDTLGTSDEFALVFNQTFSPHWKLYAGEGTREQTPLSGFETLSLSQISADSHFKSNFFSNAWLINPEDIKNKDYLIIEFSSQRAFYLSALISIFTLTTITGLAVFNRASNRTKMTSGEVK